MEKTHIRFLINHEDLLNSETIINQHNLNNIYEVQDSFSYCTGVIDCFVTTDVNEMLEQVKANEYQVYVYVMCEAIC